MQKEYKAMKYKPNEEYLKHKASIEAQYGKAEYDFDNTPLNESARKLMEYRNGIARAKIDAVKNKKLVETVKAITQNAPNKFLPIPEEAIRGEWLIPFNEKQQRIVKCWISNIKQTPKQIADYLNIQTDQVRNTMSLEAFHVLRKHLTIACKELLPLESILALRDILASSQDATKLKAALTILMDVGYIRANQLDESSTPQVEVTFDKDTQEKLRKLGDSLI